MANATFALKEPKASKETPVFLLFHFNNQRVKTSTNEKIHPENWNAAKKRAKETRKFLQYPEFNARLSTISTQSMNIYRQFVNDQNRQPSVKELKYLFDRDLLHRFQAEERRSLFLFIDKFIDEAPNRTNTRTGKPLSRAIVWVYGQLRNLLKDYCTLNKVKLDFEDIDLDFYHDFTEYLAQVKGYANNTIGRHIKTLKTLLSEARERGIVVNDAYRSKRFRVINEDSDSIYLTEAELDAMYRLDLTRNPSLERVRDLFIVGCWTGLRFSDLTRLSFAHVNGDFIEIETQKTGESVVIPVHWTVKAVMNKYKDVSPNSLPRVISNVKMNLYIKQVAKTLPQLHQPVSISMTKGGKLLIYTQPKYELVSTHTARRSFATNLYIDGVPTITIMKITGHRTEKAFLRYIKITPSENAKILQLHWQKKSLENVG